MKTVTDHIRQSIEAKAFPPKPEPLPPLEQLRETEWSREFEQLMRNRLLMGAFRYGLLETKRNLKWKLLESMHKRLMEYAESGNLEMLVDVANLCLLEYEFPSVDGAKMMAVDDGEHVEQCT